MNIQNFSFNLFVLGAHSKNDYTSFQIVVQTTDWLSWCQGTQVHIPVEATFSIKDLMDNLIQICIDRVPHFSP